MNKKENMVSEIKELQKLIVEFRDKRDWAQFHNLKDLAIDLNGEASELLEIFKWLNDEQVQKAMKDKRKKEKIEEELADVFWTVLLFAHEAKMDLPAIIKAKIKVNDKKYPVHKAKGRANKYTDYMNDKKKWKAKNG